MMKRFVFLIVLVALNLSGQNQVKVTIGENLILNSKILNEERTIQIYTPESYWNYTFQYPVLYLLDSEYEFHHTTGLINFMAGTGKIPEMIVVGIVNTNRSRDLTPPGPNNKENQEFWGEIGGAENFRDFIKTELMSYIDKNYRTAGYNIIRGQSFGGLFGVFDFLRDKPLFNAYLLTSPTVRWNENNLFKKLENLHIATQDKIKVYIGEAEFDSGNDTGIKEFSKLLASNFNDSTYFKYEYFMDESHYSLVLDATKKGLDFVYENWKLPKDVVSKGDFDDLKLHYSKLSQELGYEIKIPMAETIRLVNDKLREKDYALAIDISKKNIELYPDQPETYWHAGDAYSFAEDYTNALIYFKLALHKAKEKSLHDLEEYKNSIIKTQNKIK